MSSTSVTTTMASSPSPAAGSSQDLTSTYNLLTTDFTDYTDYGCAIIGRKTIRLIREIRCIIYFFSLKEFSMLEISAEKALSIFRRCSTALQLWMTVEWSRLPISCPIRPAGIFVYF